MNSTKRSDSDHLTWSMTENSSPSVLNDPSLSRQALDVARCGSTSQSSAAQHHPQPEVPSVAPVNTITMAQPHNNTKSVDPEVPEPQDLLPGEFSWVLQVTDEVWQWVLDKLPLWRAFELDLWLREGKCLPWLLRTKLSILGAYSFLEAVDAEALSGMEYLWYFTKWKSHHMQQCVDLAVTRASLPALMMLCHLPSSRSPTVYLDRLLTQHRSPHAFMVATYVVKFLNPLKCLYRPPSVEASLLAQLELCCVQRSRIPETLWWALHWFYRHFPSTVMRERLHYTFIEHLPLSSQHNLLWSHMRDPKRRGLPLHIILHFVERDDKLRAMNLLLYHSILKGVGTSNIAWDHMPQAELLHTAVISGAYTCTDMFARSCSVTPSHKSLRIAVKRGLCDFLHSLLKLFPELRMPFVCVEDSICSESLPMVMWILSYFKDDARLQRPNTQKQLWQLAVSKAVPNILLLLCRWFHPIATEQELEGIVRMHHWQLYLAVSGFRRAKGLPVITKRLVMAAAECANRELLYAALQEDEVMSLWTPEFYVVLASKLAFSTHPKLAPACLQLLERHKYLFELDESTSTKRTHAQLETHASHSLAKRVRPTMILYE